MKKTLILLFAGLIIAVLFYFNILSLNLLMGLDSAGADSPEELMSRYEKYHNSGDIENMMQIFYTDSTSEMIVKGKKEQLEKLFDRKIVSVRLKTLDAEALKFFNSVQVIDGKKFKHNLQVVGQIDAELESKDITHLSGGLYGIKENKYYFALIDFVN